MPVRSQLRFGRAFGELNYKFGRTLDGIDRLPGTLTTEHTYRMIAGFPELYVTCLYRWVEFRMATYLSSQAVALGKRLGRNTLIVPVDGNEEDYWNDARILFNNLVHGKSALDDNRVYLLLSACNPQSLLENDLPFILCDITELEPIEFVGFFSKVLDLFHVELERNLFGRDQGIGSSRGSALLQSPECSEDHKSSVTEALHYTAQQNGAGFAHRNGASQEGGGSVLMSRHQGCSG